MTDQHHNDNAVQIGGSDDPATTIRQKSGTPADGLWPGVFDAREIKAIGRIALILGAFALVLILVALVRP